MVVFVGWNVFIDRNSMALWIVPTLYFSIFLGAIAAFVKTSIWRAILGIPLLLASGLLFILNWIEISWGVPSTLFMLSAIFPIFAYGILIYERRKP